MKVNLYHTQNTNSTAGSGLEYEPIQNTYVIEVLIYENTLSSWQLHSHVLKQYKRKHIY